MTNYETKTTGEIVLGTLIAVAITLGTIALAIRL